MTEFHYIFAVLWIAYRGVGQDTWVEDRQWGRVGGVGGGKNLVRTPLEQP